MRCLTLADTLKRQGAQIRFVSRELPAHLRDMLAAKGMELVLLESESSPAAVDDLAHSHWLGTSQAHDVQATIKAISDQSWDWMVVDHYSLDARWEGSLRLVVKRILVIDDLADRRHDCDILLDQNLYAGMQTRYEGKVPSHCQLLLGPRYALLRDEFRSFREQVKPRDGLVKKLLVFFGGVDAENHTSLAIEAIAGLSADGLHVDVVIGAQHPCRSAIEERCAKLKYTCHVQTRRMAELMADADLAIGAGGSSTWERCCLGLPALSLCIAENQRKQIADAAEYGLLYAPSGVGDVLNMLKSHTQALLENPPLLRLISNNAIETVDGKGVERVANALGASAIEIRKATDMDSRNLFEWRNHPAIRSVSRNSAIICWEDHQSWLATTLADKDRILLIGYIESHPIGVVRFDMQGNEAEVSIYLVPKDGLAGLGGNLLLRAEHWLRLNRPDIRYVRAEVLGNNLRSQQLFLGANYQRNSVSFLKEL